MSADQEAKGGRRSESDTRRCMVGTGYRCGMRLGGRELMIDAETEAFRIKTWRAVYFRRVSPSGLTSSIISTLKKCIPDPYMVRVTQYNGILLSTTLIGIIRRPHDFCFFFYYLVNTENVFCCSWSCRSLNPSDVLIRSPSLFSRSISTCNGFHTQTHLCYHHKMPHHEPP